MQFNCSVLGTFPGMFPTTSINLLLVTVVVNLTYKSDDISCKNTFSVEKGVAKKLIPESECMKRLVTTRSDIYILYCTQYNKV